MSGLEVAFWNHTTRSPRLKSAAICVAAPGCLHQRLVALPVGAGVEARLHLRQIACLRGLDEVRAHDDQALAAQLAGAAEGRCSSESLPGAGRSFAVSQLGGLRNGAESGSEGEQKASASSKRGAPYATGLWRRETHRGADRTGGASPDPGTSREREPRSREPHLNSQKHYEYPSPTSNPSSTPLFRACARISSSARHISTSYGNRSPSTTRSRSTVYTVARSLYGHPRGGRRH